MGRISAGTRSSAVTGSAIASLPAVRRMPHSAESRMALAAALRRRSKSPAPNRCPCPDAGAGDLLALKNQGQRIADHAAFPGLQLLQNLRRQGGKSPVPVSAVKSHYLEGLRRLEGETKSDALRIFLVHLKLLPYMVFCTMLELGILTWVLFFFFFFFNE